MRYVMKQKVFSIGDDYAVHDDEGNVRWIVDGKEFSVGDRLVLRDADGIELGRIVQKVLSWGPTYEIYRDDELAAVVKQRLFTLASSRFAIDTLSSDGLEATGDFLEHEYVFFRAGEEIARVSKQWFAWSDTYGIEVNDGEDDLVILAAVVVIDLCCHGDESS